jgi:hypothetical protein
MNEAIARAERARQLLEEPLIKEALTKIREDIVRNWQLVALRDTELKDKFHMLYGIVDRFEACLKEHMETGAIESFNLKSKSSVVDFFRR